MTTNRAPSSFGTASNQPRSRPSPFLSPVIQANAMKRITRREFGAIVAGGFVANRFGIPQALAHDGDRAVTVNEVLERIRGNVGVDWRVETVDTIKAGDPATPVTGIVTTSLASVDVIRQATAAGANLVVTSQTTFYGRADSRAPRPPGGPGGPVGGGGAVQATPRPDPVYDAKNALVDGSGVVVFRLSDHWRARQPDPFVQGLAEVLLGAGAHPASGNPVLYDIPAVPLDEFASDVKLRLNSRGGIRAVGDPGALVRRVALLPGTTSITAALAAMPDADVIVGGEIREWESSEYVRDVVFSGQQKGMILVGRILSEDPGMALCARWLGGLVPEAPVRHISAGDPYWRPLL